MKQYEVTGMSCAACSARVEKAVSKVPGVTSCSVSLLTNSMGVEGTATDQEIVNAVVAAGYGAAPKGAKKEQAAAEEEEALKDHETPKLRKRLIASVIFLVVLMYFSMGHMMWGWPVPAAMKDNHVAMGLLQMLLTIIIMVINQKFFVSGFTSLLHGAPNMDISYPVWELSVKLLSDTGQRKKCRKRSLPGCVLQSVSWKAAISV